MLLHCCEKDVDGVDENADGDDSDEDTDGHGDDDEDDDDGADGDGEDTVSGEWWLHEDAMMMGTTMMVLTAMAKTNLLHAWTKNGLAVP